MKSLKGLFSSFLIISAIFLLLSNAAQPGIWNAGGGGYHLLYPEDSLNFKKIQMHSEKISMQLYPGFAIVKGEYQMKNETNDTVSIKVGYPVNGIYEGNQYGKLNLVTFDGLYKIKTLQDGKLLKVIAKPIDSKQTNLETNNNENWYVWENTFLPKKTTSIEVYFMVNTNNAHIREGYNKDNHNAFIYLLESGNVWKQPITNARFKIQLKEGLTLNDVHGISQSLSWKQNTVSNVLLASKVSFTPKPKDNIVINYGVKMDNFNFLKNTEKVEFYFDEINHFSKTEYKNLTEFSSNDPYKVSVSSWYNILFYLFFIIADLLVVLLIYYLVRYILLKKFGIGKNKRKALVFHIIGFLFSVFSLLTISFWAYFLSLMVAIPCFLLGMLCTISAQIAYKRKTFSIVNYGILVVSFLIGIISFLLTK